MRHHSLVGCGRRRFRARWGDEDRFSSLSRQFMRNRHTDACLRWPPAGALASSGLSSSDSRSVGVDSGGTSLSAFTPGTNISVLRGAFMYLHVIYWSAVVVPICSAMADADSFDGHLAAAAQRWRRRFAEANDDSLARPFSSRYHTAPFSSWRSHLAAAPCRFTQSSGRVNVMPVKLCGTF